MAGDQRRPAGTRYAWERRVHVRAAPAVLRGDDDDAAGCAARSPTRACSACSATPSPPTTSPPPARSPAASPAGQWLQVARRGDEADFNSYGSRRGNHEVMMRGTFANIRLKNELTPGKEGWWTRHDARRRADVPSIDAAMAYQDAEHAAHHHRRQGVRHRLVARLGGQGRRAARRARGDRRALRAHPPLQPRGHGGAAARVRRRRRRASRSGSPASRSFTIEGLDGRTMTPRATLTVKATRADGSRDELHGALPHRHAGGAAVLPARRHPALRAAAAGRRPRLSGR